MSTTRLSLGELAEQAGLPARTLRFYIARGLLPGPDKPGRKAAYGAEHLERLERIRALQSSGLTLSEIAQRLAAPSGEASVPEASSWRHYAVADDVAVLVRESSSPWRVRRIRNAIGKLAGELGSGEPAKGGTA